MQECLENEEKHLDDIYDLIGTQISEQQLQLEVELENLQSELA